MKIMHFAALAIFMSPILAFAEGGGFNSTFNFLATATVYNEANQSVPAVLQNLEGANFPTLSVVNPTNPSSFKFDVKYSQTGTIRLILVKAIDRASFCNVEISVLYTFGSPGFPRASQVHCQGDLQRALVQFQLVSIVNSQ